MAGLGGRTEAEGVQTPGPPSPGALSRVPETSSERTDQLTRKATDPLLGSRVPIPRPGEASRAQAPRVTQAVARGRGHVSSRGSVPTWEMDTHTEGDAGVAGGRRLGVSNPNSCAALAVSRRPSPVERCRMCHWPPACEGISTKSELQPRSLWGRGHFYRSID